MRIYPFRIVKGIISHFPETTHANEVLPLPTSDHAIFKFAKENNYSIVTSDADFQHIQMQNGFPPKVIWLRLGNTSTLHVLNKLLNKSNEIKEFIMNSESGTLEIY